MTDRSGRPPSLRLVGTAERTTPQPAEPRIRDTDWAILMAHAQDGDRTAYQRLLQEITPYLRSLAARRHRDPGDVEDAVQDILLTVHSIRRTYDPTRPFGPWLATIANRRLIDRLRRQGRKRDRETPLTPEHEAVFEPHPPIDERPDRDELERAIDALPPMQRRAIQLVKLKEMSLKEASSASGMTIASLKVNVHRAVKKLQSMFVERSQP